MNYLNCKTHSYKKRGRDSLLKAYENWVISCIIYFTLCKNPKNILKNNFEKIIYHVSIKMLFLKWPIYYNLIYFLTSKKDRLYLRNKISGPIKVSFGMFYCTMLINIPYKSIIYFLCGASLNETRTKDWWFYVKLCPAL